MLFTQALMYLLFMLSLTMLLVSMSNHSSVIFEGDNLKVINLLNAPIFVLKWFALIRLCVLLMFLGMPTRLADK